MRIEKSGRVIFDDGSTARVQRAGSRWTVIFGPLIADRATRPKPRIFYLQRTFERFLREHNEQRSKSDA